MCALHCFKPCVCGKKARPQVLIKTTPAGARSIGVSWRLERVPPISTLTSVNFLPILKLFLCRFLIHFTGFIYLLGPFKSIFGLVRISQPIFQYICISKLLFLYSNHSWSNSVGFGSSKESKALDFFNFRFFLAFCGDLFPAPSSSVSFSSTSDCLTKLALLLDFLRCFLLDFLLFFNNLGRNWLI